CFEPFLERFGGAKEETDGERGRGRGVEGGEVNERPFYIEPPGPASSDEVAFRGLEGASEPRRNTFAVVVGVVGAESDDKEEVSLRRREESNLDVAEVVKGGGGGAEEKAAVVVVVVVVLMVGAAVERDCGGGGGVEGGVAGSRLFACKPF
ncbi:hypothetical protein BC829DRAFT_397231, partial [Chytridium lagenaria]